VRLGHAAGVRPAGGGLGLTQTVNWKPVIAAVHGYVYGSGWGIAMDCDLIVAAEETKFQITEAPRGVGGATHWGSAWYWGGGRIANEMVLTGRVVTAEEMLPLGMINRVVPQEALLKTADGLAEEVASLPPLSVRCNVRMLRWFVHRMRQEAEMYQQALRLHLSEDFHESAAAFVEKRKAVVVGR
jgi:enoyl-CoA hydratase/carnithine racemase